MHKQSWRPKLRRITYYPKPDWVPEWVYTEACAAKYHYNARWEFWVWQESLAHNKPLAETEDACIRGLRRELLKVRFLYGDRVGKWFEEFLDMSDLFSKVKKWPTYLPQLDATRQEEID